MHATQLIHLDYQQAVIATVRRSLSLTHGDVFATNFICEHEQSVLLAAKKRICSHSEDWLVAEILRLKAEHHESEFGSVNGECTSHQSTILPEVVTFF